MEVEFPNLPLPIILGLLVSKKVEDYTSLKILKPFEGIYWMHVIDSSIQF